MEPTITINGIIKAVQIICIDCCFIHKILVECADTIPCISTVENGKETMMHTMHLNRGQRSHRYA